MGTKVRQDDAVADSGDLLGTQDRSSQDGGEAQADGQRSQGAGADGSGPLQSGGQTAPEQALKHAPECAVAPRHAPIVKPGNLPPVPQLRGAEKVLAKQAYIEHLTEHATVSSALEAAGVTLDQLKRFRAEDPEFVSLEAMASLFDDDLVRDGIRDQVKAQNPQMLALASKRLAEYNPARETNVNVTGSVEHRHLKDMTSEDKLALIREAAAVDAEFTVVDGSDSDGDTTE